MAARNVASGFDFQECKSCDIPDNDDSEPLFMAVQR